MLSNDDMKEFLATFPIIVKDLTIVSPTLYGHFSNLIHYVVPRGKKIRGLTAIAAYKIFEKEENLTPKNLKRAYVMAWIIEITQAFAVVIDDLMDKSETRRGVVCWHKQKHIGLNGINDGLLLEQSSYALLEKYFSDHQCFLPTYRMFHDISFKTIIGQAQDCFFIKKIKSDFGYFTMKNYYSLIKYKTSYYTFYLPVASAMYMANIYDEKLHNEAKTILLEIGKLFQIQDDFLDCYGDAQVTGKRGNDIREGKCTWLAVKALQKANPTQRKTMEKYYGSEDPDAVGIIRNLYTELSLPKIYTTDGQLKFNRILTRIQAVSDVLPQNLFSKILRTACTIK